MIKTKVSALFWPIVLILAGLIVLTNEITQLRLYLDDNAWIFPSLLKEELRHFAGYNYNFGLYRPISNFIYYGIFGLYIKNPGLAHLFGLGLQIMSSLLVYLILMKQKTSKFLAFLVGLCVLFLPFATESYMWLSGIPSLVAIILFLFQVFIVLTFGINKKTFLTVFLLQFIGVFNYESTFFFFIPFMFLFFRKQVRQNFFKKVLLVFFLIFPNFLWLVSKIIWPAHTIETRFKLIGLASIPERIYLSLANIFNLFLSQNVINLYWKENFINGIPLISPIFYVFLVLTGLFIFLWLTFVKKEAGETVVEDKDSDDLKQGTLAVFWFLCFIASLLPNILINTTSFSFRTIYLPIICLIFCISSFYGYVQKKVPAFIDKSIKTISIFYLLILLVLSIPGDLAITKSYTVNWYRELSVRDQIRDEVDKYPFFRDNKVNVYLTGYPQNLADFASYSQGEWLLSCFNKPWCGKNMMGMVTDKIKNIETVIEGKEYLLKMQKPFMVFRYEGNYNFPLLSLQSMATD